ncbi:hypothetical protein PPERSA_04059 [Pseudocohnilembus persalinus]|uniref:F-actin-capping protein subunit beta n=1 Tax=Pseudocohnilembus persalinus TaxID=266149 RepID=A0A0V0QLA2_PSEPJ|nr:hypothetical protein PPERSA_04059 [Pseudocohnilembus persalinus]|eukprot:KRX02856.1 hypothetical protein PPERSA_04059 [Pseudocohnilembus persalinus]
MEKDKILACLNLIKHLPPSKIHHNALALSNLIPDQADELLQRIDKPLEVATDPENGREYIQSEFNRDGDSFRSFWTNKYYPAIEDATYPSDYVRSLEQKANTLFAEYAKLYYQGGVHSTYFWDKEDGGFACAFLMKKEVDQTANIVKGIWDSINVIDVKFDNQKSSDKQRVQYTVTSSVILEMVLKKPEAGDVNISGSLSKSKAVDYLMEDKYVDEFHLRNIGKLVEDVEGDLRSSLDTIYVGKTKESLFKTRSVDGTYIMEKGKMDLAKQLVNMHK